MIHLPGRGGGLWQGPVRRRPTRHLAESDPHRRGAVGHSTEAYDRGRKFEQYRKLESLAEYVPIAQNRPHIDVYRRQPDQQHWLLAECDGPDGVLRLPSIDCTLALAEIYDKVEWPSA